MPPFDLDVAGQVLQGTVEITALLQGVDKAAVHREQQLLLGAGVAQQDVLLVVVTQHLSGDVIGHRRQQCVALFQRHLALAGQGRQQDLDVDLVVGGVHACRVVDGIGVDVHTRQGRLDPSELGASEVAALADHYGPQGPTVNADSVVGAVTNLGVDLLGRLHVRPDTSLPEQVDRRQQNRLHQLGGRHRRRASGQSQGQDDLLADPHRLGRPRYDGPALADQAPVIVGPRGPGQLEEPLALRERRGRDRVGIQEDVPVVERRDQPDVFGQEHAVAEDVAAHVTDTNDREVRRLDVHTSLAEVSLDRLPRSSRRDAHDLVVVAGRTSGGESIVEPVPIGLGDPVGDVGEGRGALVRGDDEIGVVSVVTNDSRGWDHLGANTVVGDVEQAGDEQLVGRDAFGQPGLPLGRRVGQRLGEEPALGAGRHDDGVLDHLGLDQT